MNIYSSIRSRQPTQRTHLIGNVRKYINNDGFAGILESIVVEDVDSIRQACKSLNVYMKAPYIRSRVMAWLKAY